MAETMKFSVPIPKGYRIYFGNLDLAGIGYRKDAALKALNSSKAEFILEPEPGNKHDSNAIMVICKTHGFFGLTKRRHIGYIPKDVAAVIAEHDINDLLFRPRSLWIGDRGGLELSFDLLGSKELYSEFFSKS
ncbi:HIRAN domain-containing protein [Marinobacterium stanieri]|uniref:HIRAN domain-containing protein n=1 Tax=Marinobacterium stanieri TaxID=49186 RepID=UPI00130371A8|nr:HIRAN domain-containing protein [Marinobacterium stanieri]